MKTLKKSGLLVLAVSSLALAACGNNANDAKYEREKDQDVFDRNLSEYETLTDIARGIKNDDARYIAYAAAEAALLDSGVMIPTTTQNGAYAITRVAPRTVPYVSYGIDEDKLANVIAVEGGDDNFLTSEDRDNLLEIWKTVRAMPGATAYAYFDEIKDYFDEKGYDIATDYKTTFSSAPQTLDILATSRAADTEFLTNGIEGLVGYNALGFLEGKVANLPTVETKEDEDGNEYDVYTFVLKDNPGVWVDNEGNKVADVTADDFVAGFQHMLDAKGGLDYLVDGVVKGVHEYLKEDGDFEDVGVEASADGKKVIMTLIKTESFFPTRLVYSCFMPLCRDFYEDKGGVFGLKELAAAKADGSYEYGIADDPSSIAYNGPFTCTQLDADSEIVYEKNTKYRAYDEDYFIVDSLTWVYDAGEDPDQTYADVRAGVYPGMNLSASTGTLGYAKRDGLFDDYSYITETNATTFFGGMNMNRGSFQLESGAVKSSQTEQQKIDIHNAMNNVTFRRALQHGWDRKAYNAVSRGEDLAETNIRNMYTMPEFVALGDTFSDYEEAEKAILELVNGFFEKHFEEDDEDAEDWEGWTSIDEFENDYRSGDAEPVVELESRAYRGLVVNNYDYYQLLERLGNLMRQGTSYGKLVQFFLDVRQGANYYDQTADKHPEVDLTDGKDGWYNAKLARQYFWDYLMEVGSEFPAEGLVIDNVYYGGSTAQTAQANAFKQSIEDTFTIGGKKYVTVNLISASTINDYYNCGYYCEKGEEVNQDIFYGSGWGPDYADPSTYLDTFKRTDGYMLMVLGINKHNKVEE